MTWEQRTTDDQAQDGSGDPVAPLSGEADRSPAPADDTTAQFDPASNEELAPLSGEADRSPAPADDTTAQFYPASNQESEGPKLPEELREMAERNAGGWVYDVDAKLRGNQAAPPEHVIGAWRIEADGSPSGEYVANPYYRPYRHRRRFGRWWKAAVAVVVLLVVAGAVLFVVLKSK